MGHAFLGPGNWKPNLGCQAQNSLAQNMQTIVFRFSFINLIILQY
jgi:hypothetical protein